MPASSKTTEERIAELDKQIEQKKARKKALQSKVKSEERKARNHRLITLGGIVEKYCGEIIDLDTYEGYVKQYANAIKKWMQQGQSAEKKEKETGAGVFIGSVDGGSSS